MLGAANNMAAIEAEVSEHASELLAMAKAPRDVLALQLRRLQVRQAVNACASFAKLQPVPAAFAPNFIPYTPLFSLKMCFDIFVEAQERRGGTGSFKGKLFAIETM